jgi:hypothetical protein
MASGDYFPLTKSVAALSAMIHQPIPCRIYVQLAAEAPVGLVFRRGPSQWVQILRWNTDDDTFEPGQWFHGRIYERRGDISPDGRYMVYFASKQQNCARSLTDPSILSSWTAVSRPPYLTALALWPEIGTACSGGGAFIEKRTLKLNSSSGRKAQIAPGHPLIPADFNVGSAWQHPADESVVLAILSAIQKWGAVGSERGHNMGLSEFWDQLRGCIYSDSPNPHPPLRSSARTKKTYGPDGLIRSVHDTANDTPVDLPIGTEWADWDKQGRLVWAEAGKIWALSPKNAPLDFADAKMLIDLNPNKFEEVVAPAWAREW